MKWRESSVDIVEGWIKKSYPHSAKGDLLKSKEYVKNKWTKRIKAWLGQTPNLDQVSSFYDSDFTLNFRFTCEDGGRYRIYHSGETSKSMVYVIQKYK